MTEVVDCSRHDQDEDTDTAELVSTTEDDDVSTTQSTTTTATTSSHPMQLRNRNRVDYDSFHKKGATQLIQVAKKKVKQKRIKVNVRDMFRKVAAIIMSHMGQTSSSEHDQLSVREGIRRFGQQAIDAVLKEYAQLHDMHTFNLEDPKKLTRQQKRRALNLITKIKKKCCGRVKAKGCADGRKQRLWINKEEVSSPTVQLESLIITALIDALEGRDVATADITGAYLIANMKDYVLVRLTGESVDIICDVNPTYKKFVTMENGKKVLYMKLVKALYGCMQSAILWYETFVTKLKGAGFKLNPYDPCVANKQMNGSQCTIVWYVDDTKISHKDSNVVSAVIKDIEDAFGKMSVKRGKSHVFVGMDLHFRNDGKLDISMKEYIKECIKAYGEEITGSANTPAKHNLFEEPQGDEATPLTLEQATLFHHIVSKLL